jgi:hypothetical protein
VPSFSTWPEWYPRLKAALFVLLAFNAAIFLFSGTPSEALDAAAWLTLFALFELETGYGDRFQGKSAQNVIRAIRLVAAVAVIAAALGYIAEGDTLDSLNSGLWIAVVMLLELEVRHPRLIAAHRGALAAVAVALYCSLGALILAWAWRGAWFDAYDALLWLTAFMAIELNILRRPGIEGITTAIGPQRER